MVLVCMISALDSFLLSGVFSLPFSFPDRLCVCVWWWLVTLLAFLQAPEPHESGDGSPNYRKEERRRK